tara:strand:+ start:507 stop:1430 length:924 start_codon:yes stop_codon:yes gene_type:complete
MILCCGEALIDLIPIEDKDGNIAYAPHNGGSIYNACIALARLGSKVGFLGGISNDFFGQSIRDGLKQSNVSDLYSIYSDRPSTVAFVNLDGLNPEYIFLDENSAGRMIRGHEISELKDEINALHFGSISLIHEPAAATLENLAISESSNRIISLDPNIRPSQITDSSLHSERLCRMISHADIVKVSIEDLEWMFPNVSYRELALSWMKRGVAIVVITHGKNGSTAYSKHGVADVPSNTVKVSDTIGAGDTFMAGFLNFLDEKNRLTRSCINEVNQDEIEEALRFASKAASITVSRQGANPPWKKEII